MTEDVLQKLLQREQVAALRHGGATSVGGVVVRAADVVSITTPADLLDAYGLPADGEDAMVVRPGLEVEVRRLPPGGATFVQSLIEGATLSEAAERAAAETPAFDLKTNLAGLMTSGAIISASAAQG